MAYCRGEVYVIGTGDGWECLACRLHPNHGHPNLESYYFKELIDLRNHLVEHYHAGHNIGEALQRVDYELYGIEYVSEAEREDQAIELFQRLAQPEINWEVVRAIALAIEISDKFNSFVLPVVDWEHNMTPEEFKASLDSWQWDD